MAKINIVGKAMVITSTIKLEDLRTVKKYRPDALVMYEGEGAEKEPVFAVGVSRGCGAIGKYGAEFGGASPDGFAQITDILPDGIENPKEYVAEKVGVAILHLNKIEELVPAVLAEIQREKEAIAANITVM